MSKKLCVLGVYGLTPLGQQLAAHHATNKVGVCICDEDPTFVPQVIDEFCKQSEKGETRGDSTHASTYLVDSNNLAEFTARIEAPRKIIVFGTHSSDDGFESLWTNLDAYLEEGDMVLRWGSEECENAINFQYYSQSIVDILMNQAKLKGVHLLEMVRLERDRVSGMKSKQPYAFCVGGSIEAYNQFLPLAAPYALMGHVGKSAGCAHYSLMIQRTIEFALMQTFAEGTIILKNIVGYENIDSGRTVNNWNEKGEKITSYLTEISSRIFYKRDNITGEGFVTDKIFDVIETEPSDAWARMEATKLGVPIPTLNAALEARYLSGMKDERIEASSILNAPALEDTPNVLKDQICEDLENAIFCAWLCAYAEAISLFSASSDVNSWDLNVAECVRLWNIPGSFLNSNLLEKIYSALSSCNEDFINLLILPAIATEFENLHMSWRRIVALSFAHSTPIPCLSSALTYYDSLRTSILPMGPIRAQRDFFGGYGFDRFDQDGWFTVNWTLEHTMLKKRELTSEEDDTGDEKKKRKSRRKTTL